LEEKKALAGCLYEIETETAETGDKRAKLIRPSILIVAQKKVQIK